MAQVPVHSTGAEYPMAPHVGLAILGIGGVLVGILLYDAYRRREEWM